MKRIAQKGFTLIEVMIVVVIVTILATVLYPSYQAYVRKTRRAEGKTALMQTMMQQERFYTQNNSYIAFSTASTNGFRWFSGDNAASSAYELSAAACPNDALTNCVQISASPGTANVNSNFRDAGCGTLTLNSLGVRSASGPDGTVECWR